MRTLLAATWVALLAANARATGIGHVRFIQQIGMDTLGGVAGSEADTQVEPSVAIDPGDSATVVAAFQDGRFPSIGSAAAIAYATSHDGGRTWTTAYLPSLSTAVGGSFDRVSDPVVVVGPDGSVYAQSLAIRFAGCQIVVAVQRSDDGGKTFGAPVIIDDDASCSPLYFDDKNWLAVDGTPTSPYYGRLYAVWDQFGVAGQPIQLRTSDDRGATWSARVRVSPAGSGGIGAQPLVEPNGDVVVVYASGALVAQVSHDGGATFDPPVTIGSQLGTEPAGMRTGDFLLGGAADPVTGELYAVWQDARFRGDGLNDIVLSRSTDGGASWSPVQIVSDQGRTRRFDRFTPVVAAHGGVVHVSFRARLDDPNKVRLRYVVSDDHGLSFSRERSIGPLGDLRWAARADGAAFLGDYMGLSATQGVAHLVWELPHRPRGDATYQQRSWTATIQR